MKILDNKYKGPSIVLTYVSGIEGRPLVRLAFNSLKAAQARPVGSLSRPALPRLACYSTMY